MSKIMGGIAIGLVVAASALLGVAETYPYGLLNSDTSAKLLGGFIVGAVVALFVPQLRRFHRQGERIYGVPPQPEEDPRDLLP